MDRVTKRCSLCNSLAKLEYQNMKGYIENSRFDIYSCTVCEASFADPLKSDEKIYNYIYKQAERVPGYERYFRFSKLAKKVINPLWYLCNAEGVYWSVREALQKNFQEQKNISILEVGSGLGYLTYSLNTAGYKTTGVDISEDAILKAKKYYGDFYEVGNIFKLAEARIKKYDCVIMTEIVEHVEDPRGFIQACLSLLKSGGKLILTTPNKSATPAGTIWQGDIPSVHLWFLAEKSILKMAESLGRRCEFIDFTEYSRMYYTPSRVYSMDEIQSEAPRLSKNGQIFPGREAGRIKSFFFGLKVRYWLSYIRRRLKVKQVSHRTINLCAVLS
jgi:SAM-dependent methyltransferase